MRARSSSDHISEPKMPTRSFSEPRSKRSSRAHLDEAQRIGGDGRQHGDAEVAHQRELERVRPGPVGTIVAPTRSAP